MRHGGAWRGGDGGAGPRAPSSSSSSSVASFCPCCMSDATDSSRSVSPTSMPAWCPHGPDDDDGVSHRAEPAVLARPAIGMRVKTPSDPLILTDAEASGEPLLTLKRDASSGQSVFEVCAKLNLRRVVFPDRPLFGGSGTYGSVVVHRASGVAVKTFSATPEFAHELVATLLAADCVRRASSAHTRMRGGIICPLGFCLERKQLVLPAYDMDLSTFTQRLVPIVPSAATLRSVHRAFGELGRAAWFLNSCGGLTHLDIKGGNVFVNVAGTVILRAVIADFSLMTLNTHAAFEAVEFDIPSERDTVKCIPAPHGMLKADYDLVLGHCATRPSEVLVDYLNGIGRLRKPRRLHYDLGLAIDMYSLGCTLLNLVINGCVRFSSPLTIFHGHAAFIQLHPRPELALEILAYRCVFYRWVLPHTARTAVGGVPWDTPDVICATLTCDAHKESFRARVAKHRTQYERELRAHRFNEELHQLLELAAVFCHTNPAARHAVYALWA